ncbi:MAG: D-amino acid dehydrogenase [Pseudomonadota bacterium]
MKVLVLGAGVIGVSSAWYLSQAGHEVTVLDRQAGAGLETSFANGSQISVSHAEPWANPHAPWQVLSWMGREDAPLLLRWRWDTALFDWSLRFLRECLPGRTRQNMRNIVALALYSRQKLQTLRAATGIAYDQLTRGILHIYTDQREWDAALQASALMREFGCARRAVSADECVQIEPALAAARSRLVGGDYTESDESGDAHRFTQNLAALCALRGVRFRYGCTVERLHFSDNKISAVQISSQPSVTPGSEAALAQAKTPSDDLLTADLYVLALGSYTPRLLHPLGIHLPIYPAKGYSATLALSEHSVAPSVSLTDDGHKIVFSRLGQRLRIAGTAEFNGYDLSLNPVRCQALIARAHSLFPQLKPLSEPEFWCGLRPATPSNVPIIGRTRYPNLYLNSGHGTLGWTLACGSAAALADLIDGRTPEPEFCFL